MSVRQTVTGALAVGRLALDAGTALISLGGLMAVHSAVGEGASMAVVARSVHAAGLSDSETVWSSAVSHSQRANT